MFARLTVLYEYFGASSYIGEPVSITQHSLQCGEAARASGADDEMIVAALLHDVGHVLGLEAGLDMQMDGCGITNHEHLGADFLLALGLSPRVCKLVRNHVQAKRYLCFKDPNYLAKLSAASTTTLGFQGGPMSEQEAQAFEVDVDFTHILALRVCDEAAKELVSEAKEAEAMREFAAFESLVLKCSTPSSSNTSYLISSAQALHWTEQSYLKVTNLLAFYQIAPASLSNHVDEIAAWPKPAAGESSYLIHWEEASATGEKILCRAENFLDYHPALNALTEDCICPCVSQLIGEEALLFKEKINFKLAGGAGFAAHQDTPAYVGLASTHVSVMVCADACTIENGCLEVAGGRWEADQVPLTDTGIITKEYEATLSFRPIPCAPGDVIFFTGYLPHRSQANNSSKHRRAMFLTFNPASQGDHHSEYYRKKHEAHNGFNAGHAISFQGDFQGKVVEND